MNMFILSILAFLFAIGVLVAVHEWGHYIVARMAGVKVLRFSIGFGKPIWLRRSGPDNTEYCLSAIPLGGYVKLLDEREEPVAREELHRAFNRVSIFSRIAILVAGPVMNFIFAVLAYWLMFVAGVPGVQPIVGEVEPDSIAAAAGLQTEDRIVAVGGQSVATWEAAVLTLLDEMLAGGQVRLEVIDRQGDQRVAELDVVGRVNELTEPGQLFSGLGFAPWSPQLAPVLGEIVAGGTAEAAGLQVGDQVLSSDDGEGESTIATWEEWVEYVRARPGAELRVVVLRAGAQQELTLSVGEISESADADPVGRIGAGPLVEEGLFDKYVANQRYGWLESAGVALDKTWAMSVLTVKMVSRIVTGDVSVKNISGPINIAQYAGYSASIGLSSFLNFLAVVSLSLGILNLLPIPVLDGGQIVMQVLEALKGEPLSVRAQIIGQQIGIAFMMLLMGFAFYNDLTRVFS